MEKQIHILPTFSGVKKEAICYETTMDWALAQDFSLKVFPKYVENDSLSFIRKHPLSLFYERICLGEALPGTLIMQEVRTPCHVFAATLFADPLLVLNHSVGEYLHTFVDLDRLKYTLMSKEGEEVYDFLQRMISLHQGTQEGLLEQGVGILMSFLKDSILPPMQPEVFHLLHSTQSTAVFSCEFFSKGWKTLFRKGYTWGLGTDGMYYEWRKKSALVSVDFNVLQTHLQATFPETVWEKKGLALRAESLRIKDEDILAFVDRLK